LRTRVTTDVGKRVRKYRLIKDLTQEQLGFDVGCGDSQISHIENGDRDVDTELLFKIAKALDVTPGSSVAWNGIGLVLVELKRFADARNAFARAVEADADSAAAHYNLSFTLSNLGDFEGALRAVRRALELDPYYVAQKFLLAIELQYEDASLTVVPDISGEQPFGEGGETFVFDQRLLDQLFTELKPAGAPAGLAVVVVMAEILRTETPPLGRAASSSNGLLPSPVRAGSGSAGLWPRPRSQRCGAPRRRSSVVP